MIFLFFLQIAIAQQPDPSVWLRVAMASRAAGLPDEKTPLALKPLAGSYSYPEKSLGIGYREDKPCQLLDISYDGKARSKKVKFREVRIAIPRGFEWK